MNPKQLLERIVVAVLFLLPGTCATSSVLAQPWVPEKKQVFLSASYQRTAVEKHLFSGRCPRCDSSNQADLGDIDSNTAVLSADIGLTDRLALSAGVPFVSARYNGLRVENPSIDDGSYHGALQDFRLEARYRFGGRAFAITPFVGLSVPTHGYETLGHTAVGANLNQYMAGAYAGRVWNRPVHTTYVQGRYSYTLFQRHEEHRLRRHNTTLEVGTFLTPWFGVRTFGGWQRTDGGLDWLTDVNAENTHAHDALANAGFYNAGGGVFFRLGETMVISVNRIEILKGENTHDAHGYIVGTSWAPGRAAAEQASVRSTPKASHTEAAATQ